MSYILEALRKSEQERERERGEIPDIKSVHATYDTSTSRDGHNVWLWLLAAVVLINGAIFAVVYLGDDETVVAQAPSPSPQTIQDTDHRETPDEVPGSPSSTATTEPVKTTPQSSTSQTPLADEQSSKQSAPKVVFSKEPLQLEDSVGNQPSVTVDATDNAVTQPADEPKVEAGLISDLPDNVRKQIPSIAFGGHIYSSSESRRSVMINGKKRREGEVIGSGLVLSAITPTGAEFEYKGYRFRLNALQDWSYQ